jgi:hypothetical protein
VPTRNQDHLTQNRRDIVATYRKYELTLAVVLLALTFVGRLTALTTSWTTLVTGLMMVLVMIQKHVLQLRIEAIVRTLQLLEHEPNTTLSHRLHTLRQLHITCDGIKLLLGIGLIVTLLRP